MRNFNDTERKIPDWINTLYNRDFAIAEINADKNFKKDEYGFYVVKGNHVFEYDRNGKIDNIRMNFTNLPEVK